MADLEAFERERMRYCEAMYALEKERKQVIERQAQFYFGIIALFLGAIALKGETITALQSKIGENSSEMTLSLIYVEATVFFCALGLSLVAVLAVFKPERRHKPYPQTLVTDLFAEDEARHQSGQEARLEADFLRKSAMRFAVAVEQNSCYNSKKAKWLVIASIACFLTVLSYAILIATIFVM